MKAVGILQTPRVTAKPSSSQILHKTTWGLEEVEAGRASILATVEPVVAAAVGIAIFSEPVTLHKLIGTLLICSSIILLNMPKKKKATH